VEAISEGAIHKLQQYHWPGNVRELENVISFACLTSVNEFVDVDDLPENLQRPSGTASRAGDAWRPLPLNEIRRQHIRRVLESCEGNRVRAAQLLGIGRTSLYRFLKRSEKKDAGNAVS
jgi:transcriptional regulator of acetoin/glycerol metabolism